MNQEKCNQVADYEGTRNKVQNPEIMWRRGDETWWYWTLGDLNISLVICKMGGEVNSEKSWKMRWRKDGSSGRQVVCSRVSRNIQLKAENRDWNASNKVLLGSSTWVSQSPMSHMARTGIKNATTLFKGPHNFSLSSAWWAKHKIVDHKAHNN